MQLVDLQRASWRGAVFLVDAAITSGGRKIVRKKIIDSDRVVQEDLGLDTEVNTISGTLGSVRISGAFKSYQDMRRDLLNALRLPGTGTLIHPHFGIVHNLVALNWSLNQTNSSLGDASISITFEPDTGDGVPLVGKAVEAGVLATNNLVRQQTNVTIAENIDPVTNLLNNFSKLQSKALSVVGSLTEAPRYSSTAASGLDVFANNVSKMGVQITQLAANPQDLADSMVGAFESLKGLYQSAAATYAVFKSFFTFGGEDVEVPTSTLARTTSLQNNITLNTAVLTMSLGYAYEASAEENFQTVEQIEVRSQELEAQFQKISNIDGIDGALLQALQVLRAATLAVFEDQKLSAKRVTEIQILPTSTALLAYRYHGSSALGIAIAELNDLPKSSYVSGTVKILTI